MDTLQICIIFTAVIAGILISLYLGFSLINLIQKREEKNRLKKRTGKKNNKKRNRKKKKYRDLEEEEQDSLKRPLLIHKKEEEEDNGNLLKNRLQTGSSFTEVLSEEAEETYAECVERNIHTQDAKYSNML